MPATRSCGRPSRALPRCRRISRTARRCYFSQMVADYDAETQKQRAAGLLSRDALNTRLRVYAVLRAWEAELRRAKAAEHAARV